MNFSDMTIEQLLDSKGFDCACGHHHSTDLRHCYIGSGATARLPEVFERYNVKKPFIVCDQNTRKAAWSFIEPYFKNVEYSIYMFEQDRVEPDEKAVGALSMAFDTSCDFILAVGSGVINDCCKVLGGITNRVCGVIATAPSMDGYASNSSAMLRNRIKVSLYSGCPAVIIADTDILKNAPMRMLWAGFGDMLAKTISICEWRISNIVTGEYYCENIAGLVRTSLNKVLTSARGLANREEDATNATMEGLILSGIAMGFSGISRPASGLEHYFSHIWDTMALNRGEYPDLHGIQVGVGTLLTLRLYERLKHFKPDEKRAMDAIKNFDNAAWEALMRRIFGSSADAIIRAEHEQYHKNDPVRHAERLLKIIDHWQQIQEIIAQELPDAVQIENMMHLIGMPVSPADIGISDEDTKLALIGSREIRDKYLLSSLMWDLGLLYSPDVMDDQTLNF